MDPKKGAQKKPFFKHKVNKLSLDDWRLGGEIFLGWIYNVNFSVAQMAF